MKVVLLKRVQKVNTKPKKKKYVRHTDNAVLNKFKGWDRFIKMVKESGISKTTITFEKKLTQTNQKIPQDKKNNIVYFLFY